MTPELRLLRYFLAVAEDKNFTKAAARLHIAQPALSSQIAKLEAQVGAQLFRRTTRTVELTPAGRVVAEHGPAALAAVDALWREAKSVAQTEASLVRIGYSASTGYGTVPRLVESGLRADPPLQLSAETMPSGEIPTAVLAGRIEAGIARTPQPVAGILQIPLRRERQGVLVAQTHPLAPCTCVSLRQIAEFPVLLHAREANPAHYDQVIAPFDTAGLSVQWIQRSVAFDPTQRVLRDGLSVAMVGEGIAEDLPEWLRWVPADSSVPAQTVMLVLPDAERGPAVARFEQLAMAVAQDAGWLDLD